LTPSSGSAAPPDGIFESGAIDSAQAQSGEPGSAGVVFETARIEGIKVAIWAPAAKSGEPVPLIVFSHGFTACAGNSSFLTAALAKAGFVVVAPEHGDSACAGGAYRKPEAPFDRPAAWNDTTYRQRGRDIGVVIDGLRDDPKWSARFDPRRIGLMGHSLGGYVVLAVAGGRPSWQRSEVRAVLAMAPLIGPLLDGGKLDNIRVPVMFQAGSEDAGTTALVKREGGAFDRTGEGYYAEIKGADHFAWINDANPKVQPTIIALSIAFFDAALRGKAFVAPEGPGVAMLKEK
jgi:predicted dienelactone hydrolase